MIFGSLTIKSIVFFFLLFLLQNKPMLTKIPILQTVIQNYHLLSCLPMLMRNWYGNEKGIHEAMRDQIHLEKLILL